MIYIFDKTQAIIKVLTNDDFTAAHLNFKINTATTFEFSLPASKALPSGSKYVATPHPLNDSKFIMLRLTERVDNTETIDYSAYELAYQELATDGYIEDKRPQNQSALNLMKIALNGSNWELNNVNVSGTATTNFYYVDRLSAISKVVDLLGGEIVFYIEIQGNAISGRYMDYLARHGSDTSKVFASGSNLLTVERQSDTSNIYTAILPRGKGKEIDNGDADTPDGYGRRINIADVEWKKSAGKPLDKPKGSIVLSDPDATAEWGQINGNARLLLQTYDDIDDVNVLINSAYKTLQSVNHPQIQYSATVADVGGLSLGDTVLIMHGDRDLSYKTRVFEVKYDLLSPDQTELSLGDDLSSNSITSQINNLNAVADTTSTQTQWTINQIGRPGTTYGATAPDSPKVGDIWFKHLPDGGTEIYRWNGDIWELLASPTTADDIAKAVNDAVSQAKSHTDEVKQGLSSDIATAKSQADSLANAAEANAKSEATSLFSRAQNALSDAKTDLTKSIASEASKAVAAANSQAQAYVNQAKSDINDTINAFSVGGRNLFLGTKDFSDSNWENNGNLIENVYQGLSAIQTSVAWGGPKYNNSDLESRGVIQSVNDTFVMSAWVRNTGTTPVSIGFFDGFTNNNGHRLADLPAKSGWIRISSQPFQFIQTSNLNGTMRFEPTTNHTDGYVQQVGLKLEKGTIATDWTPAPEDVVLDYTTKDNKIKETIIQYKETNDGHVSKLQTSVKTALEQIETKISQTDFNQKTGEILRNINEAKDTADKAVRTIGDYKTSNDKRVEAAESSIERTANSITEKVSKTDYDKKTGELSGGISTLQQRADGFDATVATLGGVNQVINSEFTPDFSGWLKDLDFTNNRDMSDVTGLSLDQYTYKQSNIIKVDTSKYNFNPIISMPVKITDQVGQISFSAYISTVTGYTGRVSARIRFYDANRVYISTSSGPTVTSNTGMTYVSETVNPPVGATYVAFAIRFDAKDGFVRMSKPMMSFSSKVMDYVQGNYNNNAALAQVKVTADGISNFVRDSSGNISSDFQTALSKTSIITGSMLATSIQKQTATQISSAITDNNGKIISLINQDSSGVQIAGKNIVLNGDTTVTGTFKVSQANIANGAIGTAQIGDAAITSAKIANLDVSKITGNVSNFIQSNWNGKYQSTVITSDGMQIGGFSANGFDTIFDKNGMTFEAADSRYGYAIAHYGTDAIKGKSGQVAAHGMEIRTGKENGVGFDYFAIKSPGANNLEFGNTTNAGHVSIMVVPDTKLMPMFNQGVTILDDLYVGNVNGAKAGGFFSILVGRTVRIPTSIRSDGTVEKSIAIDL